MTLKVKYTEDTIIPERARRLLKVRAAKAFSRVKESASPGKSAGGGTPEASAADEVRSVIYSGASLLVPRMKKPAAAKTAPERFYERMNNYEMTAWEATARPFSYAGKPDAAKEFQAKEMAVTAKRMEKAAAAAKKAGSEAAAAKRCEGLRRLLKVISKFGKALKRSSFALVSFLIIAVLSVSMFLSLLFSPYAILFSSDDNGTGISLKESIRYVNDGFEAMLDSTAANYEYDEMEVQGARSSWKDILAVYAVKLSGGRNADNEVFDIDEEKRDILSVIFRDMTEVYWEEEIRTDEESSEEVKYLIATVRGKTADEMADFYSFDLSQRLLLKELMSDELSQEWSRVIYGAHGSGELAEVAATQIGNIGGEPYWSWYGYSARVEWCACFVSWCAFQCGLIDGGAMPKFDNCVVGSEWFKARGMFADGSEEPQTGWIIFFDWEGDGVSDHVGIVESYENGSITTIEGNSGNMCRRGSYPVGSLLIYGYGIPA